MLRQIEPQAPLLVVPDSMDCRRIGHLTPFDGTGEEREDTWKLRQERMDREATRVDIDAIDTDMHARFHCVTQTQRCCHVGGLLP